MIKQKFVLKTPGEENSRKKKKENQKLYGSADGLWSEKKLLALKFTEKCLQEKIVENQKLYGSAVGL